MRKLYIQLVTYGSLLYILNQFIVQGSFIESQEAIFAAFQSIMIMVSMALYADHVFYSNYFIEESIKSIREVMPQPAQALQKHLALGANKLFITYLHNAAALLSLLPMEYMLGLQPSITIPGAIIHLDLLMANPRTWQDSEGVYCYIKPNPTIWRFIFFVLMLDTIPKHAQQRNMFLAPIYKTNKLMRSLVSNIGYKGLQKMGSFQIPPKVTLKDLIRKVMVNQNDLEMLKMLLSNNSRLLYGRFLSSSEFTPHPQQPEEFIELLLPYGLVSSKHCSHLQTSLRRCEDDKAVKRIIGWGLLPITDLKDMASSMKLENVVSLLDQEARVDMSLQSLRLQHFLSHESIKEVIATCRLATHLPLLPTKIWKKIEACLRWSKLKSTDDGLSLIEAVSVNPSASKEIKSASKEIKFNCSKQQLIQAYLASNVKEC